MIKNVMIFFSSVPVVLVHSVDIFHCSIEYGYPSKNCAKANDEEEACFRDRDSIFSTV